MAKEKPKIAKEDVLRVMLMFLRGEMTLDELEEALIVEDKFENNTLETACEEMYVCISEKDFDNPSDYWDYILRWFTFLQADYELTPYRFRQQESFQLRSAIMLGMLVASVFWLSWPIFIAVELLCALMIWMDSKKSSRKTKYLRSIDQKVQDYKKFGPFLAEEDLLSHKHLIDKFNLKYDPEQFVYSNEGWLKNIIGGIVAKIMLLPFVLLLLPVLLIVCLFNPNTEDSSYNCVYFRKNHNPNL